MIALEPSIGFPSRTFKDHQLSNYYFTLICFATTLLSSIYLLECFCKFFSVFRFIAHSILFDFFIYLFLSLTVGSGSI